MRLMTNLEIFTTKINFKTDHTKKEYKYFKLLKYLGWVKKQHKKYPVYEGICKQCNSKVIIPARYAQEGKIKSCGCSKIKLTFEQNKNQDISNPAFNKLYQTYIKKAQERKLSFDIPKHIFYNLTQAKCHYCGKLPYQVIKSRSREFIFNGLDRTDNNKGYELNNVTSCCGKCNMMKWNLKEEDFLNQVVNIYNNNISSRQQ